jgi:hypothetical protein
MEYQEENEAPKPEIDNVEATELEDDVLEDVSGGVTNNCNCSIT